MRADLLRAEAALEEVLWTTPSASRYYAHGTMTVAMRRQTSTTNTLYWLAGDQQGSLQWSVNQLTGGGNCNLRSDGIVTCFGLAKELEWCVGGWRARWSFPPGV